MNGMTNLKQAIGCAILATAMTGIGCTYKTIVEPAPVVTQQPATPVETPAPAPAPTPVAQPTLAPQPAPAAVVPQPAAAPPPQPAKPPSTIEERRSAPETVIQ